MSTECVDFRKILSWTHEHVPNNFEYLDECVEKFTNYCEGRVEGINYEFSIKVAFSSDHSRIGLLNSNFFGVYYIHDNKVYCSNKFPCELFEEGLDYKHVIWGYSDDILLYSKTHFCFIINDLNENNDHKGKPQWVIKYFDQEFTTKFDAMTILKVSPWRSHLDQSVRFLGISDDGVVFVIKWSDCRFTYTMLEKVMTSFGEVFFLPNSNCIITFETDCTQNSCSMKNCIYCNHNIKRFTIDCDSGTVAENHHKYSYHSGKKFYQGLFNFFRPNDKITSYCICEEFNLLCIITSSYDMNVIDLSTMDTLAKLSVGSIHRFTDNLDSCFLNQQVIIVVANDEIWMVDFVNNVGPILLVFEDSCDELFLLSESRIILAKSSKEDASGNINSYSIYKINQLSDLEIYSKLVALHEFDEAKLYGLLRSYDMDVLYKEMWLSSSKKSIDIYEIMNNIKDIEWCINDLLFGEIDSMSSVKDIFIFLIKKTELVTTGPDQFPLLYFCYYRLLCFEMIIEKFEESRKLFNLFVRSNIPELVCRLAKRGRFKELNIIWTFFDFELEDYFFKFLDLIPYTIPVMDYITTFIASTHSIDTLTSTTQTYKEIYKGLRNKFCSGYVKFNSEETFLGSYKCDSFSDINTEKDNKKCSVDVMRSGACYKDLENFTPSSNNNNGVGIMSDQICNNDAHNFTPSSNKNNGVGIMSDRTYNNDDGIFTPSSNKNNGVGIMSDQICYNDDGTFTPSSKKNNGVGIMRGRTYINDDGIFTPSSNNDAHNFTPSSNKNNGVGIMSDQFCNKDDGNFTPSSNKNNGVGIMSDQICYNDDGTFTPSSKKNNGVGIMRGRTYNNDDGIFTPSPNQNNGVGIMSDQICNNDAHNFTPFPNKNNGVGIMSDQICNNEAYNFTPSNKNNGVGIMSDQICNNDGHNFTPSSNKNNGVGIMSDQICNNDAQNFTTSPNKNNGVGIMRGQICDNDFENVRNFGAVPCKKEFDNLSQILIDQKSFYHILLKFTDEVSLVKLLETLGDVKKVLEVDGILREKYLRYIRCRIQKVDSMTGLYYHSLSLCIIGLLCGLDELLNCYYAHKLLRELIKTKRNFRLLDFHTIGYRDILYGLTFSDSYVGLVLTLLIPFIQTESNNKVDLSMIRKIIIRYIQEYGKEDFTALIQVIKDSDKMVIDNTPIFCSLFTFQLVFEAFTVCIISVRYIPESIWNLLKENISNIQETCVEEELRVARILCRLYDKGKLCDMLACSCSELVAMLLKKSDSMFDKYIYEAAQSSIYTGQNISNCIDNIIDIFFPASNSEDVGEKFLKVIKIVSGCLIENKNSKQLFLLMKYIITLANDQQGPFAKSTLKLQLDVFDQLLRSQLFALFGKLGTRGFLEFISSLNELIEYKNTEFEPLKRTMKIISRGCSLKLFADLTIVSDISSKIIFSLWTSALLKRVVLENILKEKYDMLIQFGKFLLKNYEQSIIEHEILSIIAENLVNYGEFEQFSYFCDLMVEKQHPKAWFYCKILGGLTSVFTIQKRIGYTESALKYCPDEQIKMLIEAVRLLRLQIQFEQKMEKRDMQSLDSPKCCSTGYEMRWYKELCVSKLTSHVDSNLLLLHLSLLKSPNQSVARWHDQVTRFQSYLKECDFNIYLLFLMSLININNTKFLGSLKFFVDDLEYYFFLHTTVIGEALMKNEELFRIEDSKSLLTLYVNQWNTEEMKFNWTQFILEMMHKLGQLILLKKLYYDIEKIMEIELEQFLFDETYRSQKLGALDKSAYQILTPYMSCKGVDQIITDSESSIFVDEIATIMLDFSLLSKEKLNKLSELCENLNYCMKQSTITDLHDVISVMDLHHLSILFQWISAHKECENFTFLNDILITKHVEWINKFLQLTPDLDYCELFLSSNPFITVIKPIITRENIAEISKILYEIFPHEIKLHKNSLIVELFIKEFQLADDESVNILLNDTYWIGERSSMEEWLPKMIERVAKDCDNFSIHKRLKFVSFYRFDSFQTTNQIYHSVLKCIQTLDAYEDVNNLSKKFSHVIDQAVWNKEQIISALVNLFLSNIFEDHIIFYFVKTSDIICKLYTISQFIIIKNLLCAIFKDYIRKKRTNFKEAIPLIHRRIMSIAGSCDDSDEIFNDYYTWIMVYLTKIDPLESLSILDNFLDILDCDGSEYELFMELRNYYSIILETKAVVPENQLNLASFNYFCLNSRGILIKRLCALCHNDENLLITLDVIMKLLPASTKIEIENIFGNFFKRIIHSSIDSRNILKSYEYLVTTNLLHLPDEVFIKIYTLLWSCGDYVVAILWGSLMIENTKILNFVKADIKSAVCNTRCMQQFQGSDELFIRLIQKKLAVFCQENNKILFSFIANFCSNNYDFMQLLINQLNSAGYYEVAQQILADAKDAGFISNAISGVLRRLNI